MDYKMDSKIDYKMNEPILKYDDIYYNTEGDTESDIENNKKTQYTNTNKKNTFYIILKRKINYLIIKICVGIKCITKYFH